MEALFRSGAAADIVLFVLAIEFVWLVQSGRRPMSALAALLPGAAFVLATRAALVGAAWWWVAAPLALSLPLHLADLRQRGWLRGRPPRMSPTRADLGAVRSLKPWRGR